MVVIRNVSRFLANPACRRCLCTLSRISQVANCILHGLYISFCIFFGGLECVGHSLLMSYFWEIPEMEILDISLTKESGLLLHALHSRSTGTFLKKTRHVERKNEGRIPDKYSSRRRLEFKPRNLDNKCRSRIPSLYSNPKSCCSKQVRYQLSHSKEEQFCTP